MNRNDTPSLQIKICHKFLKNKPEKAGKIAIQQNKIHEARTPAVRTITISLYNASSGFRDDSYLTELKGY